MMQPTPATIAALARYTSASQEVLALATRLTTPAQRPGRRGYMYRSPRRQTRMLNRYLAAEAALSAASQAHKAACAAALADQEWAAAWVNAQAAAEAAGYSPM